MKSRILFAATRTSLGFSYRGLPVRQEFVRSIASATRPERSSDSSYAKPAEQLNHDITEEEKLDFDKRIAEEGKERQIRTPWHREGSEKPPVATQRSAGAMTKGMCSNDDAHLEEDLVPTDIFLRQIANHTISDAQAHPSSHNS